MKIIVGKILYFLVVLVLIAVILAGIPLVADVPDDVTVKELSISGKRYLFIDGSPTKTLGYMSVVAYSSRGASQTKEIVIDRVEAFWPPLTPGPIISEFPICLGVEHLLPGLYKVFARQHGKLVKIYSFTKPED